jgi:DnaJ-class molecular chaperone
MSTVTDPYKILNISHHATLEDVKSAYKKKALLTHPDRGGNSEEFNKINTAYETIINNQKHNTQSQNFFNNIFGDIINQFVFRKDKCQPIMYTHKVSLEDICKRKIIKLKVSLTKFCECIQTQYKICNTCNGEGCIKVINKFSFITSEFQKECTDCLSEGKQYQGCENCHEGIFLYDKIFELYLNPEIVNGYNYIFKDQGNQSKGKNQGDFVVIVEYSKHPVFQVNNKDLILSKDISLKESLCGYEFTLQHPNGENIDIKSNLITKPGMYLKINKKGVSQEGNLMLIFNIVFPDNLEEQQKQMIKTIL